MEDFREKRHMQSIQVGPNYIKDDIEVKEIYLGGAIIVEERHKRGFIYLRNDMIYLYVQHLNYDGYLYSCDTIEKLNEIIEHEK